MPDMVLFSEAMEGVAGYLSNKERGLSIPIAKVTEANDLIYGGMYQGRTLAPHEREFLIREALTTSDFPYLFGDVLNRQMLASYKAVDPVWKAIVKMSTVPRIAPQVGGYRFAMTGGDQVLSKVGQKGEYLASTRSELRYQLSVDKYGRQFDISWETLVNDDLGALKDTPEIFGRAAARTEHRIATGLYVANAGAHVEGHGGYLYEDAVNRWATALSIASLEDGLERMAAFTDVNGEPIMNRAKYLVVPPALEMTARQILTSAQKMWVYRGDAEGGPTALPTTNVVSQMGLTLIVDPYLPILDDSSSGNTGWYLFADPTNIAALEVAHLSGHERPEVCMKASDKVSVGGGAISPFSGDFATDNVLYRVRIVFGGTALDWRATYMGGYAA